MPSQSSARAFSPKLRLRFKLGGYSIETIQSPAELESVRRLRYDCFVRERKLGAEPAGLDRDPYDEEADHLVIRDSRSGRITATYRVMCSEFVDRFSTEAAFDISRFLALPGVKVELCCACVSPDYRNGLMISLLWHGVAAYANRVGARHLFGRTSVYTTESSSAQEILSSLTPRQYSTRFSISPTPPFRFDPGVKPRGRESPSASACQIPRLLRSYLRAGGKVHGTPALDREFSCTDFLTILPIKEVHPAFRRRYFDKHPA